MCEVCVRACVYAHIFYNKRWNEKEEKKTVWIQHMVGVINTLRCYFFSVNFIVIKTVRFKIHIWKQFDWNLNDIPKQKIQSK